MTMRKPVIKVDVQTCIEESAASRESQTMAQQPAQNATTASVWDEACKALLEYAGKLPMEDLDNLVYLYHKSGTVGIQEFLIRRAI